MYPSPIYSESTLSNLFANNRHHYIFYSRNNRSQRMDFPYQLDPHQMACRNQGWMYPTYRCDQSNHSSRRHTGYFHLLLRSDLWTPTFQSLGCNILGHGPSLVKRGHAFSAVQKILHGARRQVRLCGSSPWLAVHFFCRLRRHDSTFPQAF